MPHYPFTAPELAAHFRTLADRQTNIARAMQAAHGFPAAEVNYGRAAAYADAAKLIEEHLCPRPTSTKTTRKTATKE